MSTPTPLLSCPCCYTEPCDPYCTCVNSFSSRGCDRCCSYGSIEQRKNNAVRLAELQAALQAAREGAIEECAKLCDDYAQAKWESYRRGYGPERADPHVQGQADGAADCANSIRAIKP